MGDLTGFSAGLGYDFGNTNLDFAYSHAQRNIEEGFFNTGLTSPSFTKMDSNVYTLTLSFDL